MNRKKVKIHYFVLTEIVMAMGLMMLLYVCYYASTKTIDKMDKAFTNDARGLQTISNTVERLEHKKHYNNDDIRQIFLDEFSKSGFAVDSKITPHVRTDSESSTLSLLKFNGKAIIEVRIKCLK